VIAKSLSLGSEQTPKSKAKSRAKSKSKAKAKLVAGSNFGEPGDGVVPKASARASKAKSAAAAIGGQTCGDGVRPKAKSKAKPAAAGLGLSGGDNGLPKAKAKAKAGDTAAAEDSTGNAPKACNVRLQTNGGLGKYL
jgi:hypothetical protein